MGFISVILGLAWPLGHGGGAILAWREQYFFGGALILGMDWWVVGGLLLCLGWVGRFMGLCGGSCGGYGSLLAWGWRPPGGGACELCPKSRVRCAPASPSELYPAGKIQWHFTCGFNFRLFWQLFIAHAKLHLRILYMLEETINPLQLFVEKTPIFQSKQRMTK